MVISRNNILKIDVFVSPTAPKSKKLRSGKLFCMGFYQFHFSQKINSSREEIWEFIATPRNLQKITPDYMGFEILSKDMPEKMYQGMIISYNVRPVLGINTNWVTEITHIQDKEYFVDEQRVGPYTIWHHQHRLKPLDKGFLMEDIVSYKPPFGFLGNIANSLFIRSKIKEIFAYREKALELQFGKYPE